MISKKTAETLEFNIVLERLASRTVSETGREIALSVMPSCDKSEVLHMMEETKEAETLLLRRPNYPVRSFSPVFAELSRLAAGADLNAGELLRLNSVYKAAKHAKQSIMHEEDTPCIKDVAGGLFFDDRTIRDVDMAVVSDVEIADRASDTLYHIRKSIRKENENIREKLRKIIKNSDNSASLQDNIITQRNGRYVVPVKQEHRSSVPGIVHAQSGSGATLFIEPMSVVEANNRISELKVEEQAEIEHILARLSSYFRRNISEIRETAEALAKLDVIFAKASLAISMKAVPVNFSDDDSFRILKGRHPLIDAADVIPIDIDMPKGVRSLIITGPNTGGKTVTLKLCGLFALMAQSGMFIPAQSGAVLPLFDAVFADIGDEQSISQSLSTFSSHLKNITYILRRSSGHSLAVLDELGAGTEPQEGAALAMAVLDALSDKGARIFATTHYSDLKTYAAGKAGFENASMEFDAVELAPTFKLNIGVPGMSNALLIAKRYGIKADVLDRAYGYMSADHASFVDLISSAQKASQQANIERAEAEKIRLEAEKMLSDAEDKLKKAEEKAKRKLKKADEKALEILTDANDVSEELISEAKKLSKLDEASRTKATQKIRAGFSDKKEKTRKYLNESQRKHKALKKEDIKEGMAVRIVSMDIEATVITLPDAKNTVKVMAGIMKVDIPISDLEIAAEEKKKEAKRTSSLRLNTKRQVSMEIELQGKAVDEACIELDKYLDDAFLSGLNQVFVIHGIGTGVLKNGVRMYLKKHPHVKNMRSGEYGEGGEGVTVVELK